MSADDIHIHEYTHKHTQTHTNTHKHTQTHTNTHTHIHTYTHIMWCGVRSPVPTRMSTSDRTSGNTLHIGTSSPVPHAVGKEKEGKRGEGEEEEDREKKRHVFGRTHTP